MTPPNARSDSVRVRLLNRAKATGEDYNLMLTRYALERWLYRLSISEERSRFILKGALLFSVWLDEPLALARSETIVQTDRPES